MKSLSFRKDLVGVQDELLRFAYKLTTDREEANDLLQETSLKALYFCKSLRYKLITSHSIEFIYRYIT